MQYIRLNKISTPGCSSLTQSPLSTKYPQSKDRNIPFPSPHEFPPHLSHHPIPRPKHQPSPPITTNPPPPQPLPQNPLHLPIHPPNLPLPKKNPILSPRKHHANLPKPSQLPHLREHLPQPNPRTHISQIPIIQHHITPLPHHLPPPKRTTNTIDTLGMFRPAEIHMQSHMLH